MTFRRRLTMRGLFAEYVDEVAGDDIWCTDWTRRELLERDVFGRPVGLPDEAWLGLLRQLSVEDRFIVEMGSGIWWGDAYFRPFDWPQLSRLCIGGHGHQLSPRALRERYASAIGQLRALLTLPPQGG
jgi:hypothetical protein